MQSAFNEQRKNSWWLKLAGNEPLSASTIQAQVPQPGFVVLRAIETKKVTDGESKHRYQRETLINTLIEYQVPILRATWYIKVIYLNAKYNTQVSGVTFQTIELALIWSFVNEKGQSRRKQELPIWSGTWLIDCLPLGRRVLFSIYVFIFSLLTSFNQPNRSNSHQIRNRIQ